LSGWRRCQACHHELIAAQPAQHVAAAQAGGQALAHFNEELVSDLVPVAVVDRLEAIEINEGQHDPLLRAPGQREQSLQLGQHMAPVRQVGQRVVIGRMLLVLATREHLREHVAAQQNEHQTYGRDQSGDGRVPADRAISGGSSVAALRSMANKKASCRYCNWLLYVRHP
jgi:hypothetical protein